MTVAARLSKAVSKAVRDVWTVTFRNAQRRATESRLRVIPLPGYLIDVLEPRQLLSAALDLIGVTALRNDPAFAGIDGSGGTVVVIDTGVDFSHSKLSGSKVAEADFAYGNGAGSQTITDEHGTHVAGIVGARDSNIGVATGVGLIGINVFTQTFGGDVGASETDIEQALAWVLANRERYNIVAVNMSLGSGNYSSESAARSSIVYDDVKRLEAAGVTVVTAAGNSYAELRRSGSASPGVFSTLVVGAVYEENEGRVGGGGGTDYTTAADRLTYFSQRPTTDNEIFAPGAFITSTVPGGGTKDLAGTSMASPMVAGVVALMQEAALQFGGRRLSPAEVRTIMQQTGDVVVDGDDEDTSVPTTGNSYLRVNAYNAVKFIRDQFAGGSTPTGNTDPNGTLAGAVAGPTLALDNTSPDPLAGTIGADGTTSVTADVDLYRFVVAAPGDVTITVDPTTAFQSVIRLFNSSGTSLGTFTASGGGDHDVTVQLSAGTYYVGISGAPNVSYSPTVAGSGVEGGTGDYQLFFDLDTADADGVLSGATPINLSPGDVPQALESSVGFDGDRQVGGADVDFYRVVVPDDGTLLVDIDTPDEPNYADTYIRVFDEDGNELANSDDDLATGLNGDFIEFREGGFGNTRVVDSQGGFQGHRTDSFVGGTVSRGDVYYIAVANYNNRNFQANSFAGRVSTGSTGSYSLFVGFRNNDVNGAIPQAVQTATLPVEFAPGVIGTDNTTVEVGDRDVDVIRLRPTAGGILEIDVDSYDDPSITDTVDAVLRLFDANGTLLATNDNIGNNPDPLLRFRVQANTDYYVAVSGAGNNTFDPFLLGSGGSGDTGEYTFSARLLDLSSAASLTDDLISDGGVTNLTVGQPVTASVGDDSGFARGATDVDLYRFIAPFSGQFVFTVEPSDAFGVDPYLRVFDNAGTELAADDNGGTVTNGDTGGARIVLELSAGQSYFVGVNGAGPSARAYNPVTGAGVAAGDTGGYVLEVSAGSRSLTFGGRDRVSYTDADGSVVVVSLKGPGTGTIFFDDDSPNANATRILLDGTTDRTTLSIRGDTAIGAFTINGAIKSIGSKSIDLTGDFTASGVVKSMVFRNIADANITVGNGTLSFAANSVVDSSIGTIGQVKSIKVDSWTNTGGDAEAIAVGTLTSLSVRDALSVDIRADSIGKVAVGGVLGGDVRSSGNIASLTVGSIGPVVVAAGVSTASDTPPSTLTDFANLAASLRSFSVKSRSAGAFSAGAVVAAPLISKASIGQASTGNGGTTFGLVADAVGAVSGSTDAAGKFRVRRTGNPTATFTSGDFLVKIL